LAIWHWPLASMRGSLAAHIDVARGHYVVLAYGMPPISRSEYSRLLKEKYGVEVHAVAGCIVSQSLVTYVNSYNRVVEEGAKRRFGHDIFSEEQREANASMRKLHPEYFKGSGV